MLSLFDLIDEEDKKEFEVKKSSLGKINQNARYEECRKHACEDIIRNLTHISEDMPDVIEIPKRENFHFIGRVDTNGFGGDTPDVYYSSFEERDFVSFSIINKRNISHYEGEIFYVYNLMPEDIVHIFPVDSNTDMLAKHEEELTIVPSLWITLKELEEVTQYLGVYNQITCKTKRKGSIIKPIGIITFDEDQTKAKMVARRFGIKIIKIHPNKNAIRYNQDIMYDKEMIKSVSSKMEEIYGISITDIFSE